MPPKGKGKKSKKQLEEEKRKFNITKHLCPHLTLLSYKQVSLRKRRGLKRNSKESLLKKRLKGRELRRRSEELRRRNAARRKLSA